MLLHKQKKAVTCSQHSLSFVSDSAGCAGTSQVVLCWLWSFPSVDSVCSSLDECGENSGSDDDDENSWLILDKLFLVTAVADCRRRAGRGKCRLKPVCTTSSRSEKRSTVSLFTNILYRAGKRQGRMPATNDVGSQARQTFVFGFFCWPCKRRLLGSK